MRVVIADDNLLVREGIASLLRGAGIDVIAEVSSAPELLAQVDAEPPDAVIVDIRMPPTHTDEGLVAANEIRARHPGIGIVIVSQHVDVGIAMRALAARPERLGYLLKDRVSDVDDFLDTLRRVVTGGSALDPEVVSKLLQGGRRARPLAALTEREHDVIALVVEGRSNTGIGERLAMSERAVRKHVNSIFTKLELPASEVDHRRILAVLAYLRPDRPPAAPGTP